MDISCCRRCTAAGSSLVGSLGALAPRRGLLSRANNDCLEDVEDVDAAVVAAGRATAGTVDSECGACAIPLLDSRAPASSSGGRSTAGAAAEPRVVVDA